MKNGTKISILLAFASPRLSQTLPATSTKTLDGTPVVFPKAGSQKPLLLMLGFSNKSNGDFQNWNKLFRTPYTTDARIDYFELADLQGVPSIITRMILHGIATGN